VTGLPLYQAELDRMRADLAATLPDMCDLTLIAVVTSDSGVVETPSAAGSVACRVTDISVAERQSGGRVIADVTHVATLPAFATVPQTGRITHAGVTYEIVDVRQRSDELIRRVYLRGARA